MATIIQKRRERCFCRLAARRGASMVRCSRWLRRGVIFCASKKRAWRTAAQTHSPAASSTVYYAVARYDWLATQLQAKWGIATKHAILTSASSTDAAQPWMLLQGPAFGGQAIEELVCEVTLVL